MSAHVIPIAAADAELIALCERYWQEVDACDAAAGGTAEGEADNWGDRAHATFMQAARLPARTMAGLVAKLRLLADAEDWNELPDGIENAAIVASVKADVERMAGPLRASP
jgi:hypothetical protein